MSSEAAAGPRFPAATSSERREAPVVERHRVGGMGCAWSCWTAGRTDGRVADAVLLLSSPFPIGCTQSLLSAAANGEGPGHKRTVWFRRSRVL